MIDVFTKTVIVDGAEIVRTFTKLENLKLWDKNPRNITPQHFNRLIFQLLTLGQHTPSLVMPDGTLLGGNMRYRAEEHIVTEGAEWVKNFLKLNANQDITMEDAQALVDSFKEIWISMINPQSEDEKMEYALSSNDRAGFYDSDMLANLIPEHDIDWTQFGVDLYNPHLISELIEEEKEKGDKEEGKNKLREKFLVPPFSVLDSKQGYWQARKKTWLELGIQSELGREELGSTSADGWINRGNDKGGSVFDPVLCELMYRWFTPEKATILDPFAGGSVRGVVASALGKEYYGIELRPEQVTANIEQWGGLEEKVTGLQLATNIKPPIWVQGDSLEMDTLLQDKDFDFVFSCPPYADLEVYSDDPRDLSNMEYEKFKDIYTQIIKKAVNKLASDRFACFVVGEVRNKKGFYYNFVKDTIDAFEQAGAHFYNEIVYVTPLGSLPVRVGRQFESGRKIGKTHQNVLVFYKGDSKKISDTFGSIELPNYEDTEGQAS